MTRLIDALEEEQYEQLSALELAEDAGFSDDHRECDDEECLAQHALLAAAVHDAQDALEAAQEAHQTWLRLHGRGT